MTKPKSELKPLKHITKEGSTSHVIWWDYEGRHCSEPNCEINIEKEKKADSDDISFNII